MGVLPRLSGFPVLIGGLLNDHKIKGHHDDNEGFFIQLKLFLFRSHGTLPFA